MKIAIISDIHEDLINLKLAIRKIHKENCEKIFCLGDISGFSARIHHFFSDRSASNCLNTLKENCEIIIAGNHDLHAAKITPKSFSNFTYPENWYDLDFQERKGIAAEKVWLYDETELNTLYNKTDIEFLKSLPEHNIYKTDKANVLLSHFIKPNITGSSRTFYDFIEDFTEHKSFMKQNNCLYSFIGHMHCHGITIAGENKIKSYRFNKEVELNSYDVITIPSIVRNKFYHGFCIFDTDRNTVIAKRF